MNGRLNFEIAVLDASVRWYRELREIMRQDGFKNIEEMAKDPAYDVTAAELVLFRAVHGYLSKNSRKRRFARRNLQ